MECVNTLAAHRYHAEQERDEAVLDEATAHFKDASDFFQAMFSAINKVLANHPGMAEHVDEVALRQDVETILLQSDLDRVLHNRLRDWPGISLGDVLEYDVAK